MISKVKLGNSGQSIGRIGYGAAGLAGYYGKADEKESIETIRYALDTGLTMIDTSDFYGHGRNEVQVGKAIKGRREDAFIASKFGIVADDNEQGNEFTTGWGVSFKINGTAEYAKKSIDRSLQRLNTDVLDLWYLHYPDPKTPIEETVSAMSEIVKSGKVRYIGLSNVTAKQVQRAQKVHPITAVQYEYSLWRSEAQQDLLPTLRELNIALVAWSPLGYGFFTDTKLSIEGYRAANPRFSDENFEKNRVRFAPFMDIAKDLGVTPAQLALAWLLHTGPDIFPIPGTRKIARVEENAKAADIKLDQKTLAKIAEMARPGFAEGATIL